MLPALTGVRLTPGALTQDARQRTQGPLGAAYARVRATVAQVPVVHTDDTGWRVGGEPADLMACETDPVRVDQLRPRHRHAAGQEVRPAHDDGVMVTDRGRSSDAQAFDAVRQHKCVAHIRRSICAVEATKRGHARTWGTPLKGLLPEALALWHRRRTGQTTDCKVEADARHAAITDDLRDRRLQDADHQRLLHALGWHHARGHLLRLLADPRVEPTNHRAARALRPAVVARTVSQCSKNARGARALVAFTRVIRTLRHTQTVTIVDAWSQLLRPPHPHHVHP